MIKVEVKMNLERIRETGKYGTERVLKAVDNAYMKYGFRKEELTDGTIVYWGKGDRDDFGHFASAILSLKKTDWFIDYVDKWYWYNNSGLPYEDWFYQEDLLKELGVGESVYDEAMREREIAELESYVKAFRERT